MKTELKTERQTVENIEKNLSDLKKKSAQLVSVAKTEKDIMVRKIAHLRDLTVKRAHCKREIKEFEKKELEKKSAEMKETKREKKGKKVATEVREIQRFEFSESEEDQLRCLDEEITKRELEHKAVLLEIDEVLEGSQTAGVNLGEERREKISELRTRLEQLMTEDDE